MDVTPELQGMIRSLILKAATETVTTDELLGAIIAEITAINAAVASRKYRETIQQANKQTQDDRKQGVQQALERASESNPEKHTDTGPIQNWVPPTNGYYGAMGQFVKAETWKPVDKPVAIEESKPAAEPKRMIAVTLPNGMQKHFEDTPEFRQQLEKEKREAENKETVVYVPPVSKSEKLIMQEKTTANTYVDQRSHFIIEGEK